MVGALYRCFVSFFLSFFFFFLSFFLSAQAYRGLSSEPISFSEPPRLISPRLSSRQRSRLNRHGDAIPGGSPALPNACSPEPLLSGCRSYLSGPVTFIYVAHLKTTGVVPKCFPVEVNQFTIKINNRSIEYEITKTKETKNIKYKGHRS